MAHILLSLSPSCVRARFVSREKRFFVNAVLPGGETIRAHTNNTGSMLGLLRPGCPAFFSPAENPARRLAWTLEYLFCGPENPPSGCRPGFWVGVNTSVPNRLLEAAFHAGLLPWAAGYSRFRREQRRGQSRLDALLEGPGLPPLWVECKNVTLAEDGVALFPDAVSSRGSKHLRELTDIAAAGERAAMFYLVQRPDAHCFAPADMIDPDYAAALHEAREAGVAICPHRALLSTAGIGIESGCLPCAF